MFHNLFCLLFLLYSFLNSRLWLILNRCNRFCFRLFHCSSDDCCTHDTNRQNCKQNLFCRNLIPRSFHFPFQKTNFFLHIFQYFYGIFPTAITLSKHSFPDSLFFPCKCLWIQTFFCCKFHYLCQTIQIIRPFCLLRKNPFFPYKKHTKLFLLHLL